VTVSEPSEREHGAPPSARISFDRKRLGAGDLTVAASSVVLMIGIFLPWFEFGDTVTGYYSFNAADLRTWMYIPFFVSLAVTGSVVAKAMRTRPWSPRLFSLILVGACGADLVLTVGCFVKRSPGVSWDFGAYLSTVAAVTALAGAMMSTSAAFAPPGGSKTRRNRTRTVHID
jgi:hypothetical protein